jgi:hypothetical protein
MPPPIVNQSRDRPAEQPTISLALLDQVGGRPAPPGAWPPAPSRPFVMIRSIPS